MALFAVGDCHGNFIKIFHFADKMNLSQNDGIIILGDTRYILEKRWFRC